MTADDRAVVEAWILRILGRLSLIAQGVEALDPGEAESPCSSATHQGYALAQRELSLLRSWLAAQLDQLRREPLI